MSADTPTTGHSKNGAAAPFASQLTHGRERFLAHAIEHGFEIGRRSPEDFLRHFSPRAIMEGLRDQPRLRANILIVATGVRAKVATKKSAQSAGDDLQIALDEGETDAETIVALFDPDDRVRYLDHQRLWAYVVEGEFWKAGLADTDAYDRATYHVAYLLDRALVDDLISERDIVDGITVQTLAELLPRSELGRVIAATLANARGGAGFTELDFVSEIPTSTLVKYIPLPLIWDRVIASRIALKHSLVKPPAEVASPLAGASTGAVVSAPTASVVSAPARPAPAKPIPKPVVTATPSTTTPFRVARPNVELPPSARKTRRSKPPSLAPRAPITALADASTSPEMAHILGGGGDEVDVEIDDEES